MAGISLPRRCDRAAALRLHAELIAAAAPALPEIDGSAVEQIGQATLQVLLSARRSGGRVVVNPSPSLVEAARRTGLVHALFGGVPA